MILDLPKCAEQGSRCSLSLVFTSWACPKMTQKWISKWSPLRPKVSARLLLGPLRKDFGSFLRALELKLKHVSKMYRNESRFGGLEAGCPTVEAPWNLHGISIEDHGISIEYGISMEEASTPQRRGPSTSIPDCRNQQASKAE